jgi:signal-transduction protein with cAMP-binding, CBS, and nucleotidyltransferase domain
MIRSVALFSSLKEGELKSITKECVECSFQPGEAIVKEGEISIGFCLIVDGNVEGNGRMRARNP